MRQAGDADAANNLGKLLAERGRNLREAEARFERASDAGISVAAENLKLRRRHPIRLGWRRRRP
ncbi:hypothetical protein ACFYXH_11815 [Streptomyces sp. NPDC002730]|uniref:hypothetical protein n=1 Tax=Streptomyces sp. NPDC002730 TaxID=3364662 RepID=UPI003687B8C8